MRFYLVIIALFSSAGLLAADSALVTQIRQLRNSLSIQDASRSQLTLRLADLIFNEFLKETTALNFENKSTSPELKNKLREALSLYQVAINGSEGKKIKPTGEDRYKILFQMARIHQALGDEAIALDHYQLISQESEVNALKRESFLRIAEMNEKTNRQSPKVEDAYKKILKTCEGTDLCSYTHYRLAWYYRGLGETKLNMQNALREMKASLYDSKKALREESYRDWIAFSAIGLTVGATQEDEVIEELDQFSKSQSKPELLKNFADALFANGNRKSGMKVLGLLNSRAPSLMGSIKLLEEAYGNRDLNYLNQLTSQSLELARKDLSKNNSLVEEEKIIKRLLVQLDQEQKQNSSYKEPYQEIIGLYLILYPKNKDVPAMMEAWMVAEGSYSSRKNKLNTWFESNEFALTTENKIHLRELLLFASQKDKNTSETIEELKKLQTLAEGVMPSKIREYRYMEARAYYEQKKYDLALPIFREMAQIRSLNEADTFAVQSQQLHLDILNQQKKYSELKAESDKWTQLQDFKSLNPKSSAHLISDLQTMKKVGAEAEFQYFTSLGNDPRALDYFLDQCRQNLYKPQSCSNAKVMSVQLKNQPKLIEVLKLTNSEEELVSELELSGEYLQAARMLESKLTFTKQDEIKKALKVALLYELVGDESSRLKVLSRVVQSPLLKSSFAQEESALWLMLKETTLVNEKLLSLAWSKEMKLAIAHELFVNNQKNSEVRNLLLNADSFVGLGRSQLILEQVQQMHQAQDRVQFYGKNSKKNFDTKLELVKKMSIYADSKLNSLDSSSRLILIHALEKTYKDFALAIVNSPLPDQLTEDQKIEVRKTLDELAKPIQERSVAYSELYKNELSKSTNSNESTPLSAKLAQSEKPLFDLLSMDSSAQQKAKASETSKLFNDDTKLNIRKALSSLSIEPHNRNVLEQLKGLYDSTGKVRLSAYYQGRLNDLNHQGVQEGAK